MEVRYDRDWSTQLIKCPSQCFRSFTAGRSGTFLLQGTLYLRWRGSDPWQARIIPKHDESYFWVQLPEIPNFTHDDYRLAQQWLEGFFEANTGDCINRCIESWVACAEDWRQRWWKVRGEL